MARFDEPIEPMTLGKMRADGVRSLDVSCRFLSNPPYTCRSDDGLTLATHW